MKWSEAELKALEIGVVGGFARGCRTGGITQSALLSAAGSTKEQDPLCAGHGVKRRDGSGGELQDLAIFRPGIIAGNVHTPGYVACLGPLIPGPFGTIEQDDIARASVAEFISSSVANAVAYLDNGAMRQRARALGRTVATRPHSARTTFEDRP